MDVEDRACIAQFAPRGLPRAIPLALVPLVLPRAPLVPFTVLPPRLLSPELGRDAEEVDAEYFGGFLADAGLSKNEVSEVLRHSSVAGRHLSAKVIHTGMLLRCPAQRTFPAQDEPCRFPQTRM